MVKMTVDAMGDHCPIPVVKTKKALGKLQGAGQIEVLVDNETAMKNVMKMAKSSGASAESEKISDREYKVMITVEEKNAAVSESDQKGQTAGKESRAQAEGGGKEAGESDHNPAAENGSNSSAQGMNKVQLSSAGCATCIGTVVAVSSDKMGSGNDELRPPLPPADRVLEPALPRHAAKAGREPGAGAVRRKSSCVFLGSFITRSAWNRRRWLSWSFGDFAVSF